METLLRQKVCKSKHKILITKYLTQENNAEKSKKRYPFRSESFGLVRLPYSCCPGYTVASPIRAKLLWAWHKKKNPDSF